MLDCCDGNGFLSHPLKKFVILIPLAVLSGCYGFHYIYLLLKVSVGQQTPNVDRSQHLSILTTYLTNSACRKDAHLAGFLEDTSLHHFYYF